MGKKEILHIIKDMKSKKTVSRLFNKGYCYDLALILYLNTDNSSIVFDKKKKHYMLKYKNELFDINGCIGNVEDYENTLITDNTKKDLLKILKGK